VPAEDACAEGPAEQQVRHHLRRERIVRERMERGGDGAGGEVFGWIGFAKPCEARGSGGCEKTVERPWIVDRRKIVEGQDSGPFGQHFRDDVEVFPSARLGGGFLHQGERLDLIKTARLLEKPRHADHRHATVPAGAHIEADHGDAVLGKMPRAEIQQPRL
jgi:hypothetical protein